MKIRDIVKFNNKCLFDGAVQLEWIYDKEINEDVALSYVFHGPKFHGVESNDSNYSLIDSASFVEKINNKLYSSEVEKKFVVAISSYGTGKSHLSVTMANLFSNGKDDHIGREIISRIKDADLEIGEKVEITGKERNLVIAINGVKDNNLNSSLLNSVKRALENDGIDLDVLNDLYTSINKAKEFLEVSYNDKKEVYLSLIKKHTNIIKGDDEGKAFISENLENTVWAFEIINEVYSIVTGGGEIRIDSSFTAGDILDILNRKLVIEKKIYNKILIIFDEFGRFIEYASSCPRAAGDSALQQIYESVQNAKGNIIFVGFIQFDLETYISRVADNPNIVKYVGRYKSAEKIYLSSNLETIFANLLTKDATKYPLYVENFMNAGYKNTAEREHKNLLRWIKGMNTKDVWKKYEMFNKTILKGCYPFHPLSIWLLTNLSTWMQERSTINYLSQAYSKFSNEEFNNEYLKFIYPIQIITDEFIKELTGAEEKGLQQSNFCTLYYNIISQMSNKLDDEEITILKSILIVNILGIRPHDKDDLFLALSYCTGFEEKKIRILANKLEKEHCIIIFNPSYYIYDFAIESNGKTEYLKIKNLKKKTQSLSETIDFVNKNVELKEIMRLNTLEGTDFGFDFISSTEWEFDKAIEAIEDISESVIEHYVGTINRNIDGEAVRGQFVFLFVNDSNESNIEKVKQILKEKQVDLQPIIFKIIRDNSNELYKALQENITLKSFSNSEKEKFSRFIDEDLERNKKNISRLFTIANTKGTYLSSMGEDNSRKKIKDECLDKFKKVYYKAIPFKFDGFEKNNKNQAIKSHSIIVSGLLNNNLKGIDITQINEKEISNRIKGLFGANIYNSWNAINENNEICLPKNEDVAEIFVAIENKLANGNRIKVGQLFKEYLLAPYGMNKYSLEMLIALFIFNYSGRLNIRLNNKLLSPDEVEHSVYFINKKGEKKKIELEQFYSLEFELLEESQEDIINKLYNEYELVTDISQFQLFETKVKKITQSIPLYGKYNDEINRLLEYLNEGTKRYNNIIKHIPDLSRNFSYIKNVNKITTLEELKYLNSTLDNFIVILSNKKKNMSLPKEIDAIIKEFTIYAKRLKVNDINMVIRNIKCEDYKTYHETSSFLNPLVSKFNKLQLNEIAVTIQRELKIKKELLEEMENNREAVSKINYLLSENENLHEKSVKYLIALEDKIRTSFEVLNNLKIASNVKEFMDKQIYHLKNKREIEIRKRKQGLLDEIDAIYSISKREELIFEMKKLSDDIKILSSNELIRVFEQLNEDYKELDEIIMKINSYNRKELEVFKASMKNDYYKFKRAIMNVVDITERRMNDEEEKWINNVKLNERGELERLDIEQLQKRKYQLDSIPTYISDNTKGKAIQLHEKIDILIQDRSIEWVVKLFSDLEEEAKLECFNKIKDEFS